MNDTIITKNKMTGTREDIAQYNLEIVDWGFHFFVDTELNAFKAAYQYRNAPHGVEVKFAKGIGQWMVTVFNESAFASGIDGAK